VGSRSIAPPNLSLYTGWRCAIKFTSWPLYARERTRQLLNRSLGGPYVYILELCALSVRRISTRTYVPSPFCLYKAIQFQNQDNFFFVFPLVFLTYFVLSTFTLLSLCCLLYYYTLFCSADVLFHLFVGFCLFAVELCIFQ
jgi:hypothetical protein